jgi:hypothetical protein
MNTPRNLLLLLCRCWCCCCSAAAGAAAAGAAAVSKSKSINKQLRWHDDPENMFEMILFANGL